jgi:hypothetical protein
VSRFFERSDIFSVTLPANNVYDLPAGFKLAPAADAGYDIGITPLLGARARGITRDPSGLLSFRNSTRVGFTSS